MVGKHLLYNQSLGSPMYNVGAQDQFYMAEDQNENLNRQSGATKGEILQINLVFISRHWYPSHYNDELIEGSARSLNRNTSEIASKLGAIDKKLN